MSSTLCNCKGMSPINEFVVSEHSHGKPALGGPA